MENKHETFTYTYSAKENDQSEVQRIRKKYLPQEEDKMEKLRRLDRSVVQKAQITALTIGLVGTIFLGFGMSLAMTTLGEILGSHRNMSMVIGIIVGLLGMGILVTAYPIHQVVIKRERKKIAPEIMKLTEELMK